MRVIIQRVESAQCVVDKQVVGECKAGMLLYSCFEENDSVTVLDKAIQKIINLRIFPDDRQRLNLNISQWGGEILNISQFTLSWRGIKGNRPSFENSMAPQAAENLFQQMNQRLSDLLGPNIKIASGIFGANMQIQSINDGPVTFILDFN